MSLLVADLTEHATNFGATLGEAVEGLLDHSGSKRVQELRVVFLRHKLVLREGTRSGEPR